VRRAGAFASDARVNKYSNSTNKTNVIDMQALIEDDDMKPFDADMVRSKLSWIGIETETRGSQAETNSDDSGSRSC